MSANASRKVILDRIRHNLAATASEAQIPPVVAAGAELFEPMPDTLERLRSECIANRTELIIVAGGNDGQALESVLAAGGGENLDGEVFIQDASPLRELAQTLSEPMRRRLRWSSQGPPRGGDAAGVTLAEAVVARTGSILVSTACGGRTGSVLPPLHVAYAFRHQLVAELDDALERIQKNGRLAGSLLSLITGPSRTSDIEKMLVLGAHGPRRLVLILRGEDH